jgi:hypothetical protein
LFRIDLKLEHIGGKYYTTYNIFNPIKYFELENMIHLVIDNKNQEINGRKLQQVEKYVYFTNYLKIVDIYSNNDDYYVFVEFKSKDTINNSEIILFRFSKNLKFKSIFF